VGFGDIRDARVAGGVRPALLVPVATALMFGAFLVLAQNSAVAPFIYSLF